MCSCLVINAHLLIIAVASSNSVCGFQSFKKIGDLNDLAPAYLTNLLSRYNPTRSLRSQNSGLLVVPRIANSTKGGRTFSYLAPKLWNSLPDNVWGSDTLSLFKSRLKTHLFSPGPCRDLWRGRCSKYKRGT